MEKREETRTTGRGREGCRGEREAEERGREKGNDRRGQGERETRRWRE